MPYAMRSELPDAVKKLPAHQQDAFMAAFNSAWEQHPGDEETCFKIAWAAAKKSEAKTVQKAYSVVFGDAEMKVWKAASDSGDTLDDLWFGGVLATTSVDRQSEAFTADCLKALAAAITADPLDVVGGTHSPGVDSVLGTLRKGEFRQVGDVGELYVEGFLFGDDPASKRTYRQMEAGRVAMSIGGKIAKAYKSGAVRYLAAVTPDHALACRKGTAVNADTWTAPLEKAIAEAEETAQDEMQETTHRMLEGLQAQVAQAEEDLGKAGARHSRADIDALHGAMIALQRTCGCATCSAAIEASEAASDDTAKAETEEEATPMAEDTKPDVVDDPTPPAEAPKPEEATAEPVAKSEPTPVLTAAPVDVDTIIAKAVAAGRAAAQEDGKAELDALKADNAKLREDLEALKKAAVPGGPEGKPSGEADKTETVAKSEADTMIREYLDKGDKDAAAKVLAAKMVMPVG